MLATGFGAGDRFLRLWNSWRADPHRCRTLHYIAFDRHPPSTDVLRQTPRPEALAPLATRLVAAWPALTPNIHRLEFESGRLRLLLAVTEPADGLSELVARVDAFFLDQPDQLARGSSWQPRLGKRLARLAAPAASLASVSTDDQLADGLRAAGFEVESLAADEKSAATLSGLFKPHFSPSRPPARRIAAVAAGRHVAVLGAGLAGCATAAALVDQGCSVTLLDRHHAPAAEASGNGAGVFHGVVHAHDGHHARFNRAAALEAGNTFRRLLAGSARQGVTSGSVDGLLRLGSKLVDQPAMQAVLDKLRLPADFVQALDAAQASIMAGIAVTEPAWFYPTGGWMRPAWLAACWLDRAAAACHFIGGVQVDAIRRVADQWVLLDRDANPIAAADSLVLANAGGAQRLLDGLAAAPIDWPLQQVRGQTSQIDELPADVRAPALPLSGAGYVLPAIDHSLIFGATSQPADDDAGIRAADHRENASRLALLSAQFDPIGRLPISRFAGRTAWRCVASDRLPLIGAVPAAWAGGSGGAWDQPRFVPRQPGLFMLTALGSRGLTWSPLAAQVLAAMMTGAPVPLEADLLDAIDPARFLSRANRRRAAHRGNDPTHDCEPSDGPGSAANGF